MITSKTHVLRKRRLNMKQKVLALITALVVGGSVSVYAATCSQATAAGLGSAGTAVKTMSVSYAPSKAANSAVQTAQSKAASSCSKSASTACSSAPSASAAKNQTCTGGGCAANSACKANSCVSGTKCAVGNCTASNNCGTGSVFAGKTCTTGTACTSGTSSCTGGTVCTAGNSCGSVYICGSSGRNYNDTLNSILNSIRGKTCSGASCPSSKPASSKPASSQTASSAGTPSQTAGYSAFQNEVVRLVNVERAKNGLTALTPDATIMKTATLKSQDMAKNNYFSHTSPTYGSPFDLMKKYGVSYRTAGENIAMGQTTPAQVMNGWMNSAGHRANILNSSYTKIGVGVAQNAAGQYYWTQHFIG